MNRTSLLFGIAILICWNTLMFAVQQPLRQEKVDKKDYVNAIQGVRACDEVWLVKIHDEGGCPDPSQLTVMQQLAESHPEFDATGCGWQDRSFDNLTLAHQTEPKQKTVFYIHGWRATECSALRQANAVYGAMAQSCELPPIRFVYLVWKADKTEKRYKADFIQKSEYSMKVGAALLPLMQQFGNRDLTLMGHSLGSQVILSFLTQRNMLDDDGTRYKTVFLGSALDCEFACGVAKSETQFQYQTSGSLVFNNARDFALRVSSKNVCPPRLGRMAGKIRPVVEKKLVPLGNVQWFDIQRELGCRHDIAYYVGSKHFACRIARFLNQECTSAGQ